MTESPKHWTILGAGAVGHLLACRFAEKDIPTVLVYRTMPSTQHALVNYRFNNTVQRCAINYQPANKLQTIDNLLLTVKSNQVEAAILSIKNYLTPASQIYLLQNGMGTLEKVTHLLANILAPLQIYPGANTHGVYLQENSSGILEVVHAGEGNLIFGNNYLCTEEPVRPECLADLEKLALNTSWTSGIENKLWLKLAVNAAINPLTTINHCLNGELLTSLQLKKQVELLCLETAGLYKQLNLNIKEEEILTEVFSVISKTAENQSSMLQDVKSGKNTEIEAITGHLLEKSNDLGLTMNTHQEMYRKIHLLQDNKS